jgi:DNA repair protein RadD
MIQLRDYQQAAIDAVYAYWEQGGGNPLVEMATGTGKSMVIAELVRRIRTDFPTMRVLMLVHVKELVEQNFKALLNLYPGGSMGIYSAGLGRRDSHHSITFASVQSVYRKAAALGPRHLVLVDEAHLVPSAGEGMYLQLLEGLRRTVPDLRVVGFTATPYRLGTGRLDDGDGRLFDETVFSFGIRDGIDGGYLSPLISKATAAQIDVSAVARSRGEFNAGQLETAADQITVEAVDEIIRFGENRRAWLAFCSGVDHAHAVRSAFRARGISAETVTGDTPGPERDRIFRAYRAGQIKVLTGANVFTTGFDAPLVDLIAMLRPTLSTSLYVQMVGRGTRKSEGKENCLVLDFARNVARHGPVDSVAVGGKKDKGEGDDGKVAVDSVRAKECPDCHDLVALNVHVCPDCGHEWPVENKPKHEARADGDLGILSTEVVPPKMLPVVDWSLGAWSKLGSPDSVRVTYYAGISEYREWLAFGYTGQPRQRACQWWSLHGGSNPFPKTAAEAIERRGELIMPATISVKPNGKYFDIVNRTFERAEAAE